MTTTSLVQDLDAFGLSPSMIGPEERLPLPTSGPQGALQKSPVTHDRLLAAHSPVLDALGLQIEVAPDTRAVRVISRGALAFQVRSGLGSTDPAPADAAGMARVVLPLTGRFLIESDRGTPLVAGALGDDALELRPLYAWTAPPVEEWQVNAQDTWMQTQLTLALGSDAWTRTSLAGQIARLGEPEALDVAALIAEGRFQDLVPEADLAPRRWARRLDTASLAALEQQAVRRAEALGDDLADLFDTLSADLQEASSAWLRLCHRRDDIESVRVLLREAGAGDALDAVLDTADRSGRAIRINLDGTVLADDERLRRVALGDPAAWWGSTDFEAHYF